LNTLNASAKAQASAFAKLFALQFGMIFDASVHGIPLRVSANEVSKNAFLANQSTDFNGSAAFSGLYSRGN
jgi:hypothetical protein